MARWSQWVPLLILWSSIKLLLIPSYRSTDFDVHRNWLAITRHLPIEEWYYDDVNGTTVHTLDYPPGFAFFEFILSNNALTTWLESQQILDGRCFALLGDHENTPSNACVLFHRITVVLSDVIYYLGSYFAASVVWDSQPKQFETTVFLLWFNPGLLWLDHVHFQYNGMLCGILLISLGFLMKGLELSQTFFMEMMNHLFAAFFFAVLLTMKHLYLPLGPLYFVYLLRRFCFRSSSKSFSWARFCSLGLVTGSTLVAPFLPFVMLVNKYSALDSIKQILSRLFPFGRGLVHDYWAGNVWALYVFANKVLRVVLKRDVLPMVPPLICALLLLAGLLPSLFCAWQCGRIFHKCDSVKKSKAFKEKEKTQSQTKLRILLLHTIVLCSTSAFMLAYHVHEKAIMTAIIPLTLLAATSQENARLYLRISILGHFGLLPLLFRPAELLMKVTSYVMFSYLSIRLLKDICVREKESLFKLWDYFGLFVLCVVGIFMEVAHPLFFSHGRMEFLPLLLTSIACAIGLVGCWLESLFVTFSSTYTI
mmetsp:Transcript_16234/g.24722  ORF Transcript_16234/g.24722 Transcript_16234/m.24722 type:complete len:536 (+) Transcript_16234:241-1848(+)